MDAGIEKIKARLDVQINWVSWIKHLSDKIDELWLLEVCGIVPSTLQICAREIAKKLFKQYSWTSESGRLRHDYVRKSKLIEFYRSVKSLQNRQLHIW